MHFEMNTCSVFINSLKCLWNALNYKCYKS